MQNTATFFVQIMKAHTHLNYEKDEDTTVAFDLFLKQTFIRL